MKRLTSGLVIMVLLLAGQASKAQTINNQYQFIGELALPVKSDFGRPGWSAQFKWLIRLRPATAFTVNLGYGGFSASEKAADKKRARLHLVPVMIGYRQYVKDGFFIEPQAGFGEVGGRIDIGGDYARPSVGAFMWSLGAGYTTKRLDIGLRYFSAHGAENSSGGGPWYNMQFKYVGIYAAYNLRRGWR